MPYHTIISIIFSPRAYRHHPYQQWSPLLTIITQNVTWTSIAWTKSALTASTHKNYKAADRNFARTSPSLPSQHQKALCYFATCMVQQGLARNTIKTYLLGVHQMQVTLGLGDLELSHMPQLRQILKGILVESGKHGKATQA